VARQMLHSAAWSGLAVGWVMFLALLLFVAAAAPADLTVQLVVLILCASSVLAGLIILTHPVIAGIWWLARNAGTGRPVALGVTARRSWRLLLLSAANLCLGALWQGGEASWLSEVAKMLGVVVSIWLLVAVLWPCLDSAVAKLLYVPFAGGRHPTAEEAARIDPVLGRLAPQFGLASLPWLLVRQGDARENGQAFNSIVAVGSTVVSEWPDAALEGLVAHELAHVALDHGRQAASLAAWGISFWFAVTAVFAGLLALPWVRLASLAAG
jgi:hypothetical protein